MNIQPPLNTKNLSFSSKNRPIPQFVVKTDYGPLFIKELPKADINKAGVFSFQCATEAFPWLSWCKDLPYEDKVDQVKNLIDSHRDTLAKPDGNSTILIGKDPKGKIQALFSLESFDDLTRVRYDFEDAKIGYIHECMVASKYRSQGLGKVLLDKLLEAGKGVFSDIFLEANKSERVVKFYKEAGFKPLDASNQKMRETIDFILSTKFNASHMIVMSKALDPVNSCWKKLVKNIA